MLRAVARLALTVLALGLVAFGCGSFCLGRDMERQFRAALAAELIGLVVGLSKAGGPTRFSS